MTNLKSVSLASAAALFALTAITVVPTASFAQNSQVACFGVNSCKGQSDCKSGNHDCKGMNDCKGQGFKAETAKACAAQHGSTTPPAN